MKNYIISALSFLGGAALGGVIVWKVLDKKAEEKYKVIADEEIASVKKVFTVPKKEINNTKDKEDLKKAMNKPDLNNLAKEVASDIARQQRYTNYSNVAEPERNGSLPWEEPSINVIEPDKYGEREEYDQIELTLYADGILADDKDDVVDKEVVGDALDHIGEFDDDIIHVQDDEKKRYYEITVDNRSYEDVTGREPPEDSKEE